MVRKFILIFLPALLLSDGLHAQSGAIAALVASGGHDVQLYFYPSTLRMLNVNKDPNWNKMVKDVKHLRLLTFSDDSLLSARRAELLRALEGEGFEEVMTFRSPGASVRLFGKYSEEEMQGLVGFIMQEDQGFVVELEGMVDPIQLYSIYENGIDLPVLDSYFKNKDEEEKRREKYRKFRDSMQEEGTKADSLANQDTLKSEQRTDN